MVQVASALRAPTARAAGWRLRSSDCEKGVAHRPGRPTAPAARTRTAPCDRDSRCARTARSRIVFHAGHAPHGQLLRQRDVVGLGQRQAREPSPSCSTRVSSHATVGRRSRRVTQRREPRRLQARRRARVQAVRSTRSSRGATRVALGRRHESPVSLLRVAAACAACSARLSRAAGRAAPDRRRVGLTSGDRASSSHSVTQALPRVSGSADVGQLRQQIAQAVAVEDRIRRRRCRRRSAGRSAAPAIHALR